MSRRSVGSFDVSEVVFFDFDVCGGKAAWSWSISPGRPEGLLEEIEAYIAGSRSLLCMWRIRGEVGSTALSCDTVRSTLLRIFSGRENWVHVLYMPALREPVAKWGCSLWSIRDGSRFIRGGICFKEAGPLEVRFEDQRVFEAIEVAAFSDGSLTEAHYPVLIEQHPARRCSRNVDHFREAVAPISVPEEAFALDARPISWEAFHTEGD